MNIVDAGNNHIYAADAPLALTATGAAGAAVTLTIPAAVGSFHYLSSVVITKFASALLVAAAAPVTVTTTNLNNTPSFDFDAAADAQGTIASLILTPAIPIKSSAANTNTTFVCPATTAVIWKVTAFYTIANS